MARRYAIILWLSFFLFASWTGCDAYRVEINLPTYTLRVYKGDFLQQVYPIAIGAPHTPTPGGSFVLINKLANPTWYRPGGKEIVPPGANNPLGSHWLGLDRKGYGLHGTIEPNSIGKAITQGCIRLHNDNIAELYRLLSVGTPVEIIYQPFIVTMGDLGLTLQIFPDIYGVCTDIEGEIREVFDEWGYKTDEVYASAVQEAIMQANGSVRHIPLTISMQYKEETLIEGGYYFWGEVWLPHREMGNLLYLDNSLQDWYIEQGSKLKSMVPLSALKENTKDLHFLWQGKNQRILVNK